MIFLKIIFVLLVCHVEQNDAFFGSIGTSILDGIKTAIGGFFKAIWNGIVALL